MSDKDTQLKNQQTRKRLALLGLAAHRREADRTCPDDERFAVLLEAEPGSAEQQHFFDHLSVCESCREKWLVLSEELGRSSDREGATGFLHGRRGLLSIVGSACAVAVGVMLYLSIDYRPVLYEDGVTQAPADQDQAPAAESARVDGLEKEAEAEKLADADAGQIISEPKRHRQEPQVQLPAKVKTSPAPKTAEKPVERRSLEQTLSNRQSFSVAGGAMKQSIQFGEFIDSFLSYCGDRHGEVSRAAQQKDIIEQGKSLLEREGTGARHEKAMIDKIIQLLGSSEPVKDTELEQLCEEAERRAAETNRAPR